MTTKRQRRDERVVQEKSDSDALEDAAFLFVSSKTRAVYVPRLTAQQVQRSAGRSCASPSPAERGTADFTSRPCCSLQRPSSMHQSAPFDRTP